MESEDGEVILVGRAEIDTRPPFRSVKEAIVLFGERVLASEVYTNKLNEMRAAASNSEHGLSDLGSVSTELEETKQTLERAKEDNLVMANCLYSLREELQKTQEELQQLKTRESGKRVDESQLEDLKFVENATDVATEAAVACNSWRPELQRRRYVKFANPPTLAQVIITPETPQVLERTFSVDSVAAPSTAKTKKKKKKPLMHLLAGIFSKKKGHQEVVASPKARAQ
ncbi:hypothetical protein Taro_008801 [Colocasia esculenta]|uniref:WEB family protein n=1 Tax=Colocasia esculenta TaxID=4460 RepID=A0A843U259_COLES|nr:hypothetical protein [Colocasia esculenta]